MSTRIRVGCFNINTVSQRPVFSSLPPLPQTSEGKGAMGEPPQVYGVVWDPFAVGDAQRFVTYGAKSATKLWTGAPGGRFTPQGCSFGKVGKRGGGV